MNENFNRWQDVWIKKGQVVTARFPNDQQRQLDLADLLALNGYDTNASNMGVENWLSYVDRIAEKLHISSQSAVCEIGCGAGALLFPLYNKGARIWGADYASSLIQICQRVMPQGTFVEAEACTVPFDSGLFDVVLSSGVFIYFPDLQYAESAFQEIARLLKPDGRAALLDLNDAALQDEYASIKIQALGQAEYDRMYKEHHHLFYDKSWIESLAAKYHLRCVIKDQMIIGYPNAALRFNVFLENDSTR